MSGKFNISQAVGHVVGGLTWSALAIAAPLVLAGPALAAPRAVPPEPAAAAAEAPATAPADATQYVSL